MTIQTTDRLSINPLTVNDDNFILKLVNSEGWLKFIGNRNVNTRQEARAYILKILKNKNVKYWIVSVKETQTPAGIVTFIKRDYLNYPDIGFAFLPEFSGNGYAHEATSVVLKNLIQEQSVTHILATTIPENTSSIKLLKKFGLRFEKEIQVENEKLHVYGASVSELAF